MGVYYWQNKQEKIFILRKDKKVKKIFLLINFLLIITLKLIFSQNNYGINIGHLDHLGEDRGPFRMIWLYCDYPKYENVGDSDEGIACVDDAARAIVTYCRYYELTGDTTAIERAYRICKFVETMHAPKTGPGDSSEYWNFVWEPYDGTSWRNEGGPTSFRQFSGYASRAVWGFGYAIPVFMKAGGTYSNYAVTSLKGYIDEFKDRGNNDQNSGTSSLHGITIHSIIFNNAHLAGTAILGAGAKSEAYGNDDGTLNNVIQTACDDMVNNQNGDINTYPFCGILTKTDNVTHFQGYGALSVAGLAYAAKVYNDNTYLTAAKKAVDYFYTIYLTSIFPGKEGRNPAILEFPQIAYDISPMVEGCYRVYEASKAMGDPSSVYLKYAKYAGLFASWFIGNNIYGVPAYDPATGICFDGLEGPGIPIDNRINRNSGGESTVETLNSLLLVLPDDNCRPYAYAREIKRHSCIILEAEEAETIVNGEVKDEEFYGPQSSGQNLSELRYLKLNPGGMMRMEFYTENSYDDLSDNYLVYLYYSRRTVSDIITIEVDGIPVNFDIGNSPDSDFIWCAKLTNNGLPAVFNLSPGKHSIKITAGTGSLDLDQINIQPVVQRKTFQLQSGETFDVDRKFLPDSLGGSVPSGLSVSASPYGNTLDLEWQTTANTYGYNVYRKAESETGYQKLNQRPVTKQNYIDNGLTRGISYYYKISSLSNNALWGESLLSSSVSEIPLSPQATEMEITETEFDWAILKNGILFNSLQNNGFADTRTYEIDLDKYPDLSVSIDNPSGKYWSMKVLRWLTSGAQFFNFEEFEIQSSTRDTGQFTYNIKSICNLNGNNRIKLRFMFPDNNSSAVLKELKIYNKNSGEVYDTITSPQLWFENDGVEPDYYVPDISLMVNKLLQKITVNGALSENTEMILSKNITADFDHYKSINFKIDSDDEWEFSITYNDSEYMIKPYSKTNGGFFYNLDRLLNGSIKGLSEINIKFKIKPSSAVAFNISEPILSTAVLPFFSDYRGVQAIPNPFTPASEDERFNKMVFYFEKKYGEKADIKIFTINGKVVKKIENAVSGKTTWDGKDTDNRLLSSGLYIFQISTDGKVQTGSVILIR